MNINFTNEDMCNGWTSVCKSENNAVVVTVFKTGFFLNNNVTYNKNVIMIFRLHIDMCLAFYV